MDEGNLHFVTASAGNTRNDNNDSGDYWCRAENQFGYVDSKNATIIVAWLNQKFKKSPKATYSAELGKMVQLDCSPPEGNPDPEVHWLFNGSPIDYSDINKNQKINIDDTGNLIIYNVNRMNAGQYQCVATQKDLPRHQSPGIYSRMTSLEVLGKYFITYE